MSATHPILRLFLRLVAFSSHVAPFVGKRSKCGGQEGVSGFVGLLFALCRFCEHFLWTFHERVSWSSFFPGSKIYRHTLGSSMLVRKRGCFPHLVHGGQIGFDVPIIVQKHLICCACN